MDIHRITHPLRLAKGSHQPGSGKGCAMNVISYINGDAQITDFPACSARPLAALVHRATTYWPAPTVTCYQTTAWSPLISGGRQSEPPMFLIPSSTLGSRTCWPTPTGVSFAAPNSRRGDSVENRVVQLTGRAIRSWRDLAGLDNARRVDQAAVDNAARLIAVPA